MNAMTPKKKLVEVALPLPEINDASAYDKMPGIGPHPKGIHHWWARLPLPTARAILFASVVDDPESHPEKWPTEEEQNRERERLFDILRRMMQKKLHQHPEVYEEALQEMVRQCGGKLPAVFDPFAGGGSIPLEASRMGFEAHAADLNPVAVLLNKCNLELAPRWSGHPPVNPHDRQKIGGEEGWSRTHGLAADVRYYAGKIGRKLIDAIGHLYPTAALPQEFGHGQTAVVAWIWTRTVASPNPVARGKYVPIASSFVLSAKGSNAIWVQPLRDDSAEDGWRFEIRRGSPSKEEFARARLGTKAGKGQDFICLLTDTPIQRSYIQAEGKAGKLRERLIAIVAEGSSGKLYLPPDRRQEEVAASMRGDSRIADARATTLSGSLPTRAEITGGVCTAYGLSTWGHLFSDRQILALLSVGDAIKEAASEIAEDAAKSGLPTGKGRDYAETVTTFLALAADRCADFNNCLCRWSPSNQKVMNLFGKQALPMVFDFAEANFLGTSVGSWNTCSEYVADCIEVIDAGPSRPGIALQQDAATEHANGDRILISTDPPYYNNISYAVLSDFFYVWLRRSIGPLYPDIFGTVLTPKLPELIAAANRFEGDPQQAKQHFEQGFQHAFTSFKSKMDPRFPLTVYYAFKQDDEDSGGADEAEGGVPVDLTTGWETLLEALISSGFQITATWPVRASQKWRMVSMGANALASYIVLACRPRPDDAPQTDRRSFAAELKRDLPAALKHLQQGNIAPVDFAQAAIGPGMAIYSRYSRILESTGNAMTVRTALSLINQTLTEVLSSQEDEFDPDTRWAISWFEQHGFDEGDFGDAELLSKAKVTSIAGLRDAHMIHSKAGRVRLLRPDELSPHWDPVTDKRLTIWEMTHHILRLYVHDKAGDVATAELLHKLGNSSDVARDLAYRLFNVCEKKKLSQEAQAYNALVLGWSEIARLARETAQSRPSQAQLLAQE
jgi:putative DNA methylase